MTEAASIEHTVVNILSDVLDESVEDLHDQPVLAAYDWDSLTSLEALAQLESQLGMTLDLRAYHAARRSMTSWTWCGARAPRPPDSDRNDHVGEHRGPAGSRNTGHRRRAREPGAGHRPGGARARGSRARP